MSEQVCTTQAISAMEQEKGNDSDMKADDQEDDFKKKQMLLHHGSGSVVPQHQGSFLTKEINQRRKDEKALKHLKQVGTLPQYAGHADLHNWRQGLGQYGESGEEAAVQEKDGVDGEMKNETLEKDIKGKGKARAVERKGG